MANLHKVNPYGEYDAALQKFFSTKQQKKEYLKKNNLAPDGSMESVKHRTERIAASINEERKKQGLKPKTVQELVGTTRHIPTTKYFF